MALLYIIPALICLGITVSEMAQSAILLITSRRFAKNSTIWKWCCFSWFSLFGFASCQLTMLEWIVSPYLYDKDHVYLLTPRMAVLVAMTYSFNFLASMGLWVQMWLRLRLVYVYMHKNAALLILLVATVAAALLRASADVVGALCMAHSPTTASTADTDPLFIILFASSHVVESVVFFFGFVFFVSAVQQRYVYFVQFFSKEGLRFLMIATLNFVMVIFAMDAAIRARYTTITNVALYMQTWAFSMELHAFLHTTFEAKFVLSPRGLTPPPRSNLTIRSSKVRDSVDLTHKSLDRKSSHHLSPLGPFSAFDMPDLETSPSGETLLRKHLNLLPTTPEESARSWPFLRIMYRDLDEA